MVRQLEVRDSSEVVFGGARQARERWQWLLPEIREYIYTWAGNKDRGMFADKEHHFVFTVYIVCGFSKKGAV